MFAHTANLIDYGTPDACASNRRAEAIKAVVDKFPPLTREQVEDLAAIFHGGELNV